MSLSRADAMKAFQAYIGDETKQFQMYADPKVPGCWAGRIIGGNPDEGYLIQAPGTSAEEVEEFTVDVWPPKSGPLRFFI